MHTTSQIKVILSIFCPLQAEIYLGHTKEILTPWSHHNRESSRLYPSYCYTNEVFSLMYRSPCRFCMTLLMYNLPWPDTYKNLWLISRCWMCDLLAVISWTVIVLCKTEIFTLFWTGNNPFVIQLVCWLQFLAILISNLGLPAVVVEDEMWL